MNLFKAFILTCTITLTACGAEPQIIYVYPQGQDPQQQQQLQQQQPLMQDQSQTQAYPVNQPQSTNLNNQFAAVSAPKTATPINPNLKTTLAKIQLN